MNNDLAHISDQLRNISELLENLLLEQRRTNLAFDNIGEDICFKNEIICCDLSEVDTSFAFDKTLLLLGFRKQDVKKFVERIFQHKASNVQYVPSIERISDFVAIVTNCSDEDTLLINCSGITKSQELLNEITDTIEDGILQMKIGKGSSARSISLDIPQINYIFFETTSFLVPRILRDAVDCCIWNENDKKPGEI